MSIYTDYANNRFPFDDDYISSIESAATTRRYRVYQVIHDLAKAAASLGQTESQIENKVDALFSTFAAEWSIYILTGATAIIDAIQNDATLPWIDTDVNGTSIRQRLINRLSQ